MKVTKLLFGALGFVGQRVKSMLGEAAGGVYGNMWWPPSPTVCCIHTQGGGDETIDTQGVIMVSL